MLLVLVVVFLIGCGGGPRSERVDPVSGPSAQQELRTMLERVVETGQGGSELGVVMEKIDALEKEDAALATALRSDADELMSAMGNTAAIQAKAREMLKKLE